jgi:hypothetical protein
VLRFSPAGENITPSIFLRVQLQDIVFCKSEEEDKLPTLSITRALPNDRSATDQTKLPEPPTAQTSDPPNHIRPTHPPDKTT